jgi:hypothetical protein
VYRWRRGDAVSSDAVTFANREATAVGKVRLAKGTAALPIGQSWAFPQKRVSALPTALAHAVGKAGNFPPFLLLFSII